MAMTLYVGNRNYSSWSLRAHLMAAHVGVPFDEVMIPLDTPASHDAIVERSPSGRVPALHHDGVVVWDSLAIAEYLAETFPKAKLWPEDRAARAVARSVSAEMHAGFASLRASMPMNLRAKHPGYGRTIGALRDIERIVALWNDCRARFGRGGPFLFGAFSAADAMYAPVVARFVTYDVTLDDAGDAYAEAVRALPALVEWTRAAVTEREHLVTDDFPEVRR
jgi:glutathione S-transferase